MNKPSQDPTSAPVSRGGYWSKSLRIVCVILLIWSFISLGCGILFREQLDAWLPNIGGAPFGFWMAQQGSIIGFLLLLFIYRFLMNRLDKEYGFGQGDQS
jgi:putative solute:sodium symporter small subunit